MFLGFIATSMVVGLSPQLVTSMSRRAVVSGAAAAGFSVRSASAKDVELIYDVSGLRWADLRAGQGPVPQEGERATIDYMMTRQAGSKIYSTKDSGQPFSWVLGNGKVIEGLEMGILGRGNIPPMRAGGIRRLVVPQPLGYGVGRGLFKNGGPEGVRELLPIPPEGFEWRNQNGEIVNAFLRFKDTYMNEMRLDEPGLVFDVILSGVRDATDTTLVQAAPVQAAPVQAAVPAPEQAPEPAPLAMAPPAQASTTPASESSVPTAAPNVAVAEAEIARLEEQLTRLQGEGAK